MSSPTGQISLEIDYDYESGREDKAKKMQLVACWFSVYIHDHANSFF